MPDETVTETKDESKPIQDKDIYGDENEDEDKDENTETSTDFIEATAISPRIIENVNKYLKESCVPLTNEPLKLNAELENIKTYLKLEGHKIPVTVLKKQLKKLIQEEKEKSQTDFNKLLETNPKLFDEIIKELKEKILPVLEPLQQDNLLEKISENKGIKLSSLKAQLKKEQVKQKELEKKLKDEEKQKELEEIEKKQKELEEIKKVAKESITKAKEKEIEKLTKDKKLIELPRSDLVVSEFARDLGQVYINSDDLFYKIDTRQVVFLDKIKYSRIKEGLKIQKENEFMGFSEMTPSKFITYVERNAITWKNKLVKDGDGTAYHKKCFESITPTLAKTILESQQFQEQLPPIKRIFTIPIPIIYDDKLTFPKKGYDERFFSWLDPNAPEIIEVEIEEAKTFIKSIFEEFCFKEAQDKIHAIAALVTPYFRGLYNSFNERTPLFFYIANRERAGKDYCAGITGITYEGIANEDPPISDGEKFSSNKSEEFRKKILSMMIQGKKRFHSSNNKGKIENSAFEGVITAKTFSDRLLGRNETITIDNEMDFSVSGNLGVTYSADLENRSRNINLSLEMEDPNKRIFKRPDLHNWVLENRGKIISCLFALVKNWFENEKPKGKTPFTSFPNWASICGGIMVYNGLGDPCEAQKGFGIAGNSQDREMKILFELGYKHFGNKSFKKKELIDELKKTWQNSDDIFTRFNFEENGERAKFSIMFLRYVNRIFSDIKLEAIQGFGDISASYRDFQFKKEVKS